MKTTLLLISGIMLFMMGVISTGCNSNALLVIDKPNPESVSPIVRLSGNNYSWENMVSLMHLATDNVYSQVTAEDVLNSAVKQAEDLNLNSGNLNDILTKLIFHIDRLDFAGKNVTGSGVQLRFMLSDKTAQLPYLIEKARYNGQEVWIVILNWEMNYDGTRIAGSHVAVVVFKYGSDDILFAMSCD